jgi:hypothetical protein
LTKTPKRLILLAFVSYEAVRLWWWGGSSGVVDFGKSPKICPIPTSASSPFVGICEEKAEKMAEFQ